METGERGKRRFSENSLWSLSGIQKRSRCSIGNQEPRGSSIQKVRLLNVRVEEDAQEKVTTFATVFVANDKREHFLKKLEKYADPASDLTYEDKPDKPSKPKHADLINSIADIRGALAVEFFWTDESSLIPGDDAESVEVWLSSDNDETESRFRELYEELEMTVEAGSIRFPERKVVVVEANREQLERLSYHSDDIAEYRRAKETAAFWLDQENADQTAWVHELLSRLEIDSSGALAVCILDSGANHGRYLTGPTVKLMTMPGELQTVGGMVR